MLTLDAKGSFNKYVDRIFSFFPTLVPIVDKWKLFEHLYTKYVYPIQTFD